MFDDRTLARLRVDDGVTERVDFLDSIGANGRGGGTVVDGLVVGTGDPTQPTVLVALDPETRAVVWKAPAPTGWEPVSSNGAVLARGSGGAHAGEVWAVRGESGAPLWRRALGTKPGEPVTQLAAPGDGCAYAVVNEEGPEPMDFVACDVTALDVGTGAVRWSYRAPLAHAHDSCGVAADADMVVVAPSGGTLHVLDAATGALRARVPVDAPLIDFYQGFGMLVRAPMAYVLTGSSEDMYGMGPPRTLVALDLDEAKVRWKHQELLTEKPPVADDERIYVQTDGGGVRALALLDGTTEWSWYAGALAPTALLVPPEAPRWLLVADGVHGFGGTVGFDLHARPRRSDMKTRIAGRVVQGHTAFDPAGIPVRVADQVVTTDALGRFSADVEGEGQALVEAMVLSMKARSSNPDSCPTSSVERAPLDGKPHEDVRLTVELPECAED
jgi:outer membrane protein assembly factor BamB